MDVWKNASTPYIGATKIGVGNAQLVALEVIISKLLRKMLGMADRSFAYLAAVHAASLPLIGGFQAAVSDPTGYKPTPDLEVLKAAAGTVPAVWAAEYIVQTGNVGFHVPKPSMRDAMMTAASKMLTKPLIGLSLNRILPDGVRDNFEQAGALEANYNRASNLRRQPGVGGRVEYKRGRK